MARRGWWRSVAAQVWLMVLVCATVVLGLVAVNTRADVRHDREAVGDMLERRGVTNAAGLAVGEEETQATLNSILEQPAIAGAGPSCPEALATIQKAVSAGYIVVVNAAGVVLCAASPKDVKVGEAAFAEVPVLRKAIASAKAGSDGPFTDPRTRQLMMFTAVPDESRPGTSLVYLLDSQEFFAPVDDDGTATSIAVDGRTSLVAMHYPVVAGAVGTSLSGTPLARALGDASTLTTATGLDGIKGLYRTAAIEGTPYRLLIGVSESKAYAAARASLRRNLLIALGLMVAMALMGLLLQRRVARPARALRGAINALAEDPEAAAAPTDGPTELADVARAFNATTQARRRADGLSRAILQNASDLLLATDKTGRLTFVAPAAEQALGLSVGDHAVLMLDRLHPDDRDRVALRVKEWMASSEEDLRLDGRLYDAAGDLRFVDVRVQDLRHAHYVNGLVITAHDITERKRFEEHLSHQARHDPLTGLANRAAVLDRLEEQLGDRRGLPVCVFFVDLDRFKLVNDSHGHATGDKVLIALARKLEEVLRPDDLIGRFGGDEFVIVTTHVSSARAAEEVATRIRATLEEPLSVGRRELFVSGSVGIAIGEYGDAPDQLLRNADTAMYRAKEHGRNCSAVFDDVMRDEAQHQLRTESELHRALERDQLVLHFQPVLALGEGRITGVEALVRWNHPERGLVPPLDFIPVAEETGLVVPIGSWVLQTACTWAAHMGSSLGMRLQVSVNVSPRQLAQPEIVNIVDEALRVSGLASDLLTLEVTESVLVHDAAVAARALTALHDRGVRLSIDDFGTGWSSLSYLQQFPVDEIKLDHSYVSRVDTDNNSATIAGALVGMAHAMGLSVVAEGVETPEQARFLRSQGCDLAQGFYFARPMPGHEVQQLLIATAGRVPVPREDVEEETTKSSRRIA